MGTDTIVMLEMRLWSIEGFVFWNLHDLGTWLRIVLFGR